MSSEVQSLLTQQAKRQNLPITFLREKVYPELYEALLFEKLTDQIIEADEIRKHQERLKRKKVFDKLEQKRVEKEKLKADLGSEYVSSEDDSLDFDDIGLEKQELEKILQERKQKEDPEEGEEPKEEGDDSNLHIEKKMIMDESGASLLNAGGQKQEKKENLVQIEEKEEVDEDHGKEVITAEREKIKNELKQQREDEGFNPLKFLALKLKEVHEAKKNQK